MPTFIEHASHERDSRSERVRATPLPRRNASKDDGDEYDVVVVGVRISHDEREIKDFSQ